MSQDYLPLPDPLETAPRYTTVDAVKTAMGIDDDSYDAAVLQSIVTFEYLMDAVMGTSYPQTADPNAGTDDALDPAPVEGIPVTLSKAAKLGAIKLTKLDDTATGTFGADSFVGEFTLDDAFTAVRSVLPLMLGLRRDWGLA